MSNDMALWDVTYRVKTLMLPTRTSLALPLCLGIVPAGSMNPATIPVLDVKGARKVSVLVSKMRVCSRR